MASRQKLNRHSSSRYYIDKHSPILTLTHPRNGNERVVCASVRVLDIKQRTLQTRAVWVVWRRLMKMQADEYVEIASSLRAGRGNTQRQTVRVTDTAGMAASRIAVSDPPSFAARQTSGSPLKKRPHLWNGEHLAVCLRRRRRCTSQAHGVAVVSNGVAQRRELHCGRFPMTTRNKGPGQLFRFNSLHFLILHTRVLKTTQTPAFRFP